MGSPDQPEKPVPHPLSSDPPPLGSIHLFPPRAPSQPPIATINVPPSPLHAPVSDHAQGRARPSVAQEASIPLAPASPALPWSIMGPGNKPRSFAAAARSRGPHPQPTPSCPANRPTNLSFAQLQNLSHEQLIVAYKLRFRDSIQNRRASKVSLQNAYLQALEAESSSASAPVAPAVSSSSTSSSSSAPANRPKPRPVSTTEFTITHDPSMIALQGPHGDPAAIVRSLQTHIHQAFPGGPPPITLLSGRWSFQLSF